MSLESIVSMECENFFEECDWELLKHQKLTLLKMFNKHDLSTEEASALDGIINMIDVMQDIAVDVMQKTEEEVFEIVDEVD